MVHIGSFKEDESFREGIRIVIVERGDCPDDVIEAGEFRVIYESEYCAPLTVRCKEQLCDNYFRVLHPERFFPFVRLHDECLSCNSDADFAPREFILIPEFRQVRISLQSGSVRPSPVGMSHQDTHGLRPEAS